MHMNPTPHPPTISPAERPDAVSSPRRGNTSVRHAWHHGSPCACCTPACMHACMRKCHVQSRRDRPAAPPPFPRGEKPHMKHRAASPPAPPPHCPRLPPATAAAAAHHRRLADASPVAVLGQPLERPRQQHAAPAAHAAALDALVRGVRQHPGQQPHAPRRRQRGQQDLPGRREAQHGRVGQGGVGQGQDREWRGVAGYVVGCLGRREWAVGPIALGVLVMCPGVRGSNGDSRAAALYYGLQATAPPPPLPSPSPTATPPPSPLIPRKGNEQNTTTHTDTMPHPPAAAWAP